MGKTLEIGHSVASCELVGGLLGVVLFRGVRRCMSAVLASRAERVDTEASGIIDDSVGDELGQIQSLIRTRMLSVGLGSPETLAILTKPCARSSIG